MSKLILCSTEERTSLRRVRYNDDSIICIYLVLNFFGYVLLQKKKHAPLSKPLQEVRSTNEDQSVCGMHQEHTKNRM